MAVRYGRKLAHLIASDRLDLAFMSYVLLPNVNDAVHKSEICSDLPHCKLEKRPQNEKQKTWVYKHPGQK